MKIHSFSGEYDFLSNFYPCVIVYRGITYPTLEHAYQASKTKLKSEREKIAKAETPGIAKRLGRKCTIREDWEEIKLTVMENLLWLKFNNRSLEKSLLATGDAEIIEGNNWGDTFWGKVGEEGENHLGRLLMELREKLRNKKR